MASPATMQALSPDFFDQISVYVQDANESAAPSPATHGDAGEDDWDWNEDDQHARGSSPRRSGPSPGCGALNNSVEAKAVAESFASTIVERLQVPCDHIKPRVCTPLSSSVVDTVLQECGQEFALLNDEEYESTNGADPRSLVAQLCHAALDPSRDEIPELQRVRGLLELRL